MELNFLLNGKKAILFSYLGTAAIEFFSQPGTYCPPTSEGDGWNVFTEAVARLQKQFEDEPNVLIERHTFHKRKPSPD